MIQTGLKEAVIELPLESFVDEVSEISDLIEAFLLQLEEKKDPAEAAEKSGGIKRELHTLKGSASLYGFSEVSELAHIMEDIFSNSPEKIIGKIDGMLRCLDLIREMVRAGPAHSDEHLQQYKACKESLS